MFILLKSFTTFHYFILLFFIGMIIYSILDFFFFSKKARVKRKLRGTPHRSIKSFMNGESGKIIGLVQEVPSLLTAPLSGRKCVFYRVEVWQKEGKHDTLIIEEEKYTDLVVYDGSAYAHIQVQDNMNHLIFDRQYYSGAFNDANEKMENLLKQHGKKSTGVLGWNKSITYKEAILEVNEAVVVTGKVEWKSASQSKIKLKGALQLLEVSPSEEHSVYFSDDPKLTKQ